NNLLHDELYRAECDVFVAVGDVVQQLVSGPVMPCLPKNVRQRDCKGDQASEPDPFSCEMTALRREQERNENTNCEKCSGMFVFEAESQQRTEPRPKRWRPAVDNADKQINASHPEQRLKRVHGKKIANCQTDQPAE